MPTFCAPFDGMLRGAFDDAPQPLRRVAALLLMVLLQRARVLRVQRDGALFCRHARAASG